MSREITATATMTATAKSCRIGSGWFAEQRWGRKEGYASETTGRCSIFCLIMKSVNVVVLFVFFVFFYNGASQAKGTEGGARRRPRRRSGGTCFATRAHTEGDERQQISTGFRIRRLNINNSRMLDLSIASRALFTESQYFTKYPYLLCYPLVPSIIRGY